MTAVLWVIIYGVVATGAYWGLIKIDRHYENKLRVTFEKTEFEAVQRYYARKKFFMVNNYNVFVIILVGIIGFLVWALWPIVVIGSGTWNWVAYKRTMKEGKAAGY